MLRRLRTAVLDAVPPSLSPEGLQRLFWVFPLAMVGALVPLAHVVLHTMPFLFAFSVQILALIGILWISLPVLKRANRQG